MKKQFISLLFVLAGAAGLTSCESWLDETSNSEIREEDHFSTEEPARKRNCSQAYNRRSFHSCRTVSG